MRPKSPLLEVLAWVVRRIGYVIGSRCSASSQAVRFGSTADSVASWPGGALVSQAGNPAVSVKPADCAARWRPQIRAFGRQEQARCGRGSLVQSPHNNSFKPNRSEEHTSELQSLMRTSYAVFCLKKKKKKKKNSTCLHR